MSEENIERRITIVTNTGEERDYFPAHQPINRQVENYMNFWWEELDGSLTGLVVNLSSIAVLETVVSKGDAKEEILELIAKAKAISDSEGGEE